jgi:uncharacterized membrane protein
MSEYEFFNQKVEERQAAALKSQAKQTPLVLLRILIPVVIALVLIAALQMVGFVSVVFSAILAVITLCYGSFKAGRIWHKIKF